MKNIIFDENKKEPQRSAKYWSSWWANIQWEMNRLHTFNANLARRFFVSFLIWQVITLVLSDIGTTKCSFTLENLMQSTTIDNFRVISIDIYYFILTDEANTKWQIGRTISPTPCESYLQKYFILCIWVFYLCISTYHLSITYLHLFFYCLSNI